MANVSLINVNKIYPGDVTAVRDFNLDIKHGEFVVLVGPSGCGKSTTLRMIAGLEEISKGEVRIENRVVNDLPSKDRDIAMVFQNYALYPHMTVRDNMGFGLKLRKFKKAEITQRVQKASEILGLTEYLDRRPKELSGGQRQRVAMGRAIVREPAVFLFDEPLSNLDAKMRVDMRREILQLHLRIQSTMVYVTHDQVEAMTLGDRICVMRDGIIEQVGEPAYVFRHPATLFVARFIGTPPMNIFKGRLTNVAGGLVFDGGSFKIPIDKGRYDHLSSYVDKPICLGLRPKSFLLRGHPEASDSCLIKGRIEVVERLGEEVLAHIIDGDHRFSISTDPYNHLSVEQEVEICPVMDHAQLFDMETEKNLTSPVEGEVSIRQKH